MVTDPLDRGSVTIMKSFYGLGQSKKTFGLPFISYKQAVLYNGRLSLPSVLVYPIPTLVHRPALGNADHL